MMKIQIIHNNLDNYFNPLRLFYKWLNNHDNDIDHESWQTPEFMKIKNKKSKRITAYLESENWEKKEYYLL